MNKPAPWLEGIEGKTAHELIESKAPVIRVVAGPGSGKTTCLKRRTERLILGDMIDSGKIYVGTFTRAIASELNQEAWKRCKSLNATFTCLSIAP